LPESRLASAVPAGLSLLGPRPLAPFHSESNEVSLPRMGSPASPLARLESPVGIHLKFEAPQESLAGLSGDLSGVVTGVSYVRTETTAQGHLVRIKGAF